MTDVATDRIEKHVTLRAPVSRVWRALTDAAEFGAWFGVRLESPFAEGAVVRGRITHPGYDHLSVEMFIERIDPTRYFSYRWHPYAVDPKEDYSGEPTTLVEFTLGETKEGAELTITESGFERIPLARRAEAWRMNDSGWTEQAKNIERYVSHS